MAILAVFTLRGGLLPNEPEAEVATTQRVGGLVARVEDTRWVDNASAGPLYVVSGELRNEGTGTPLGRLWILRLVDADGEALTGWEAALGPPLDDRDLRERDAKELLAAQEHGALRLARLPLKPGERWLFDAVLVGVPDAAGGFEFEAQAVAEMPATPSLEEVVPLSPEL